MMLNLIKTLVVRQGFFISSNRKRETSMKQTAQKVFMIFVFVISSEFAYSQTAVADTNKINCKNFNITGDKLHDVKKLKIAIVEGFGQGIIHNQLIEDGKCKEAGFPANTGLYHLLIRYNNQQKAAVLFLYMTDPSMDKITIHIYAEGALLLCRVTSQFSEDLNKLVVLE